MTGKFVAACCCLQCPAGRARPFRPRQHRREPMLRLACEEALFCSCSSMYFKAVFILRMYWAANLTVSTITVEARRSVAREEGGLDPSRVRAPQGIHSGRRLAY